MSNFITNAELRIEAERLCDENDELRVENAKLRELLSMYVTFARVKACDHIVQIAHVDGMGKVMDEAEMRKRAMELGIEVAE